MVETPLNTLVEQTLSGKRKGSENAQKFLEQQLKLYETRLRDSENSLAEFKTRNVGLMPTDQGQGGGGYFQQLQTEIDAAKKSETDLNIAMARRAELARQLRGEAVVSATGSTPVIGAAGIQAGTDTVSRIKETQARLETCCCRSRQASDVIAAREALQELQRRRTAEIESLKAGDANAVAASGAGSNPVAQASGCSSTGPTWNRALRASSRNSHQGRGAAPAPRQRAAGGSRVRAAHATTTSARRSTTRC